MVEINQEEMQQELFSEFSNSAKSAERFGSLNKAHKPILFSTSIEQIILLSITLILLCCFMFFLGVLRGKSLVFRPPQRVLQNKIVAPVLRPDEMSGASFNAGNVKAVNESAARGVSETPNVSRPYTLQLSTYKKQEFAEKEVAVLRQSGYFASVVSNDGFYEVYVGQYATKEDAKMDLKIFKPKYKDCFLKRR